MARHTSPHPYRLLFPSTSSSRRPIIGCATKAMAGEVVIVTGAGAGIGFHLTVGLLDRGHRVAAIDLATNRLRSPGIADFDRLLIFDVDVTDADAVAAAVTSVLNRWNDIDVLVNNACVAHFAPFERKDLESIRREFDVNFFGFLHLIRAVLPHFTERGRGLIHNVGSGVGLTGFPGLSGYASTKGAIEALTRTLDLELRPQGIVVNMIHPPLTRTESSAPLGLPSEAMADPAEVGRRLAARILSTRAVVAPDWKTRLGLLASRHCPVSMGRLLARMTRAQRHAKA
jgi:NAD(P)-dependent dehydrogenase (short-subunit alcohol dehydrogenase family)